MSQKIVFMGTPEFSIPTLKSLTQSNHKISAVYSQPARKSNRGMKDKIPLICRNFLQKKIHLTLNHQKI